MHKKRIKTRTILFCLYLAGFLAVQLLVDDAMYFFGWLTGTPFAFLLYAADPKTHWLEVVEGSPQLRAERSEVRDAGARTL